MHKIQVAGRWHCQISFQMWQYENEWQELWGSSKLHQLLTSISYPCSSLVALPSWIYHFKPTLSFGLILNLKACKDLSGFKCSCQHCAWLHSEYIQHTGVGGKVSPEKYQFITLQTFAVCKEGSNTVRQLVSSSPDNPVTKGSFKDRFMEGQKRIIFDTHFFVSQKHIFQH